MLPPFRERRWYPAPRSFDLEDVVGRAYPSGGASPLRGDRRRRELEARSLVAAARPPARIDGAVTSRNPTSMPPIPVRPHLKLAAFEPLDIRGCLPQLALMRTGHPSLSSEKPLKITHMFWRRSSSIKPMKFLMPWLIVFLADAAGTQSVPPLINYQGRLGNTDGTPFPTADYEMRLSLYDAATNGNLVWGPQIFDGAPDVGHGPRLPMVQGHFNVMLGPVDTQGRSILGAFVSANRFVEVAISNRPAMAPRPQILPAPFAVQAANGVPAGTVVVFAGIGSAVPEGWLLCNGRAFPTNVFLRLWAIIGTYWGGSTNQGYFNRPDLRGLFLRGVDFSPTTGVAAGQDPNVSLRTAIKPGGNREREVGSFQSDAFQGHWHHIGRSDSVAGGGARLANGDGFAPSDTHLQYPVTDGVHGEPRISSETRPVNAT